MIIYMPDLAEITIVCVNPSGWLHEVSVFDDEQGSDKQSDF